MKDVIFKNLLEGQSPPLVPLDDAFMLVYNYDFIVNYAATLVLSNIIRSARNLFIPDIGVTKLTVCHSFNKYCTKKEQTSSQRPGPDILPCQTH